MNETDILKYSQEKFTVLKLHDSIDDVVKLMVQNHQSELVVVDAKQSFMVK